MSNKIKWNHTSQLEAEDIKKAETPQTEMDNKDNLNASPGETEDSTSSHLSASTTAAEFKINPPTQNNVTLMDVDSPNDTKV